jgi:ketosteroid isomerase-like protein
MSDDNERVVMDTLRAIEERDLEHMARLQHPDVWFSWPPGLPYSGRFQGPGAVADMTERFASVWAELQPTAADRRMDAVVVAAHDATVVVHYTWRGRDQVGKRFETPTLARYEVRDGLFAGAEMYYFDLLGLIEFLSTARRG